MRKILARNQSELLHEFEIVEEVLLFGDFAVVHANERDALDTDSFAGRWNAKEVAGVGALEGPVLDQLVVLPEAIIYSKLNIGKAGDVVGVEGSCIRNADDICRYGVDQDVGNEVVFIEQVEVAFVDDFIPDANILLDVVLDVGIALGCDTGNEKQQRRGNWCEQKFDWHT